MQEYPSGVKQITCHHKVENILFIWITVCGESEFIGRLGMKKKNNNLSPQYQELFIARFLKHLFGVKVL